MTLTHLHRLYAHMEWADAHLWRLASSDRRARGDDYVLDSLHHLHLVQHAYLAVWLKDEVATPSRDDFDDPPAIRDWGRDFHRQVAPFLAQLLDARLLDEVAIPWTEFIEAEIGAPPAPASLGDMLLQVPMHSVHHRAQINRRIRELGGEPDLVDYIGWIWRGRPAADWSSS